MPRKPRPPIRSEAACTFCSGRGAVVAPGLNPDNLMVICPACHPAYQSAPPPSVDAAIALIPDGWALDHLCEHWNAMTGEKRGATCKLVDLSATKAAQTKEWVEVEGETLADAIRRACAKARSRLAG